MPTLTASRLTLMLRWERVQSEVGESSAPRGLGVVVGSPWVALCRAKCSISFLLLDRRVLLSCDSITCTYVYKGQLTSSYLSLNACLIRLPWVSHLTVAPLTLRWSRDILTKMTLERRLDNTVCQSAITYCFRLKLRP